MGRVSVNTSGYKMWVGLVLTLVDTQGCQFVVNFLISGILTFWEKNNVFPVFPCFPVNFRNF